ncbi:hypothetical protein WJX72_006947 [[Myrmecia] bisecta]|uniref:Uncharacterized protein n=1 Tax=[Myrmecia] bisecta TaxID=41462 RepID=A0AAW1R7W3_9CHLO
MRVQQREPFLETMARQFQELELQSRREQFAREWGQHAEAFSQQCAARQAELLEVHQGQLADLQARLERRFRTPPPTDSEHLQQLRRMQRTLVKQKKFIEALEVLRAVDALERKEAEQHSKRIKHENTVALKELFAQHALERAMLQREVAEEEAKLRQARQEAEQQLFNMRCSWETKPVGSWAAAGAAKGHAGRPGQQKRGSPKRETSVPSVGYVPAAAYAWDSSVRQRDAYPRKTSPCKSGSPYLQQPAAVACAAYGLDDVYKRHQRAPAEHVKDGKPWHEHTVTPACWQQSESETGDGLPQRSSVPADRWQPGSSLPSEAGEALMYQSTVADDGYTSDDEVSMYLQECSSEWADLQARKYGGSPAKTTHPLSIPEEHDEVAQTPSAAKLDAQALGRAFKSISSSPEAVKSLLQQLLASINGNTRHLVEQSTDPASPLAEAEAGSAPANSGRQAEVLDKPLAVEAVSRSSSDPVYSSRQDASPGQPASAEAGLRRLSDPAPNRPPALLAKFSLAALHSSAKHLGPPPIVHTRKRSASFASPLSRQSSSRNSFEAPSPAGTSPGRSEKPAASQPAARGLPEPPARHASLPQASESDAAANGDVDASNAENSEPPKAAVPPLLKATGSDQQQALASIPELTSTDGGGGAPALPTSPKLDQLLAAAGTSPRQFNMFNNPVALHDESAVALIGSPGPHSTPGVSSMQSMTERDRVGSLEHWHSGGSDKNSDLSQAADRAVLAHRISTGSSQPEITFTQHTITPDQQQLFDHCKHGRYDEARALLKEGVLSEAVDEEGTTPLMLVAQGGYGRLVKLFLRKDANINARNLAGNTALHFALANQHKAVAKYLIAQGADDGLRNLTGLTCYEWADRLLTV